MIQCWLDETQNTEPFWLEAVSLTMGKPTAQAFCRIMSLKNIDFPMPAVEALCQKWNLAELALFGSVLRDDFCAETSDVDVMVQFHPDALIVLKGLKYFGALEQIQTELEELFDRDVDVIVRSSLEQSHNYLRRREILSTAKIIYASERSARSA